MTPRLSVIIPSRNGLDTLPRALASALAMPLDRFEVVVVDDGSTDGTFEYLLDLAARDPRVVPLRRTADHGASAARNAGIAAARAPVIGFLDADDLWKGARIVARLAWHEANPETVMSFSAYQTLLMNGEIRDRCGISCPRYEAFVAGRPGMVSLGTAGFSLLSGENPVCTSSVLASRVAVMAVGGFDTSLRQAEDWDLWIRLSHQGEVVASTAVELLHADRPDSLSYKIAERIASMRTVVRRHRMQALRRAPGAAFAAASMIAQAQAEHAQSDGRFAAAFLHSSVAAALSPSLRALRDAARAALVVAGLKPPMLRHA